MAMDDTRNEDECCARSEERDAHPNFRVFMIVRSLVVLNFLGTASYGITALVLPILMTEVSSGC